VIASVERQMYYSNSTVQHRRDNRKRTKLKFVTTLN